MFTVLVPPETGFPGELVAENPRANAGDVGLILRLGKCPAGGHGNPLQYSCLEHPYGQRNLVGDNLWGRKELDVTEVT